MMKILKEKVMNVLTALFITGGDLSIDQCCFGFSYEAEIPDKLVK